MWNMNDCGDMVTEECVKIECLVTVAWEVLNDVLICAITYVLYLRCASGVKECLNFACGCCALNWLPIDQNVHECERRNIYLDLSFQHFQDIANVYIKLLTAMTFHCYAGILLLQICDIGWSWLVFPSCSVEEYSHSWSGTLLCGHQVMDDSGGASSVYDRRNMKAFAPLAELSALCSAKCTCYTSGP